MNYTDKQYEYLEQFEDHLRHAEYEGYCRIVNRGMLIEFDAIYKDVFKSSSKILNGCNKCVLGDIKKLARLYFQDKAEKEAQKAQLEAVEPEKQPETPEKPKKAATTKKTAKNKKK